MGLRPLVVKILPTQEMCSFRLLAAPSFRPMDQTSGTFSLTIMLLGTWEDPLQVTRSDHDVKELLNNEEHQLLMQLKELPCENYTHHHILDMEASNVAAAQAAAETNHACATHQAPGIVNGPDKNEATCDKSRSAHSFHDTTTPTLLSHTSWEAIQ